MLFRSCDPDDPDNTISVRLGTFDGDPGIRPEKRNYVANAAVWEPIPDDGLPRFDESSHADYRYTAVGSQADARTRTGDPFITSEVLYQLSYVGRGIRL